MRDERITVYSPRFSVPGAIVERGLNTVRINFQAPSGLHRSDWFHAIDSGPRSGQRMGDHDDPPVRYSVAPAIRDEAA